MNYFHDARLESEVAIIRLTLHGHYRNCQGAVSRILIMILGTVYVNSQRGIGPALTSTENRD